MECRKTIIFLMFAIFIFSFTTVSASDMNDTAIDSDDTSQMGLSASNEMDADNLKTIEENTTLVYANNVESVGDGIDSTVMSEGFGTYSGLAEEIGHGGNIELKHDYYTYDSGAFIDIKDDNSVIDGKGAVIDMAGSYVRAFYVSGSGVIIKNLTIKNSKHKFNRGGAIYFNYLGTVTNCNFINNTAKSEGGAVYFSSTGEVTNCNLTNNSARYGGVIHIHSGNVLNCNFVNNTAYEGGAIFIYSGNVTNCNFVNNTAYEGGAIFIYSGNVTNCNFTNNTASQDGGAVYFYSTGNVSNCNFTDNAASCDGGTIACRIFNAITVDRCLFKTSSDTTHNVKLSTSLTDPELNIKGDNVTEGSNATITITNKTYNGEVTVIIGDKNYPVTLVNGEGSCNVSDLKAGNYTTTVILNQTDKFQATNKTTNFTVKNKLITIIKSSAVTTTYATSKNIIITLTDKQGKALSGKKVSVVLKGVSKMLTTNNKGQSILATGTTLVPKTYKSFF